MRLFRQPPPEPSPPATADDGDLSPARRAFARVLLLATVSMGLSRGPSLLPRTPQDQALVTAGAGALGAVAALVSEGLVTLLARVLGGRRLVAHGGRRRRWGRGGRGPEGTDPEQPGRRGRERRAGAGRRRPRRRAGVGGWGLVPRRQRHEISNRALTAAIAAGSAAGALRSKLAEPSDLVKATILYDRLPSVSGGEGSLLPIEDVDREGRKFVGCATSPERIAAVMGENDVQSPIRVFAGLGSADTPEERARLAIAELVRLGGLDKKRIVVFSPAGTGLVNPVAPEAEEFMSRGDVGSVCVQYSQKRSVRARKDLALAQETFRLVLEELDRAVGGRNGNRPEIVVYGESLGAWVIAEAIAEGGAGSIRGLGIDRGAILGVPFPVRSKLRRVLEAGEPLPDGVAIHSNLDEVVTLPKAAQEAIRYLVYTHPEDPVGNFEGVSMAWRRPRFLRAGHRHKRVPKRMRWYPVITFLQLLFDLKNGTGASARSRRTGTTTGSSCRRCCGSRGRTRT